MIEKVIFFPILFSLENPLCFYDAAATRVKTWNFKFLKYNSYVNALGKLTEVTERKRVANSLLTLYATSK
jgi:hypothetical protein